MTVLFYLKPGTGSCTKYRIAFNNLAKSEMNLKSFSLSRIRKEPSRPPPWSCLMIVLLKKISFAELGPRKGEWVY